MKKKVQRRLRRENLARSIDLTWSSLRTHLADAVEAKDANEEFHAKCVREYAEVIYTLSVELHALTGKDFKVTHEGKNQKIPRRKE